MIQFENSSVSARCIHGVVWSLLRPSESLKPHKYFFEQSWICAFKCTIDWTPKNIYKFVINRGERERLFDSWEREGKLKITFPFYGKGTGIRKCYVKGREI